MPVVSPADAIAIETFLIQEGGKAAMDAAQFAAELKNKRLVHAKKDVLLALFTLIVCIVG